MNMKAALGKFFLLLGIAALAAIIWLSGVVLKSNSNSEIPKEMPCAASNNFNLYPYILKVSQSNLIDSFPYELYLDSADRCDLNSISKDVDAMDSVNPADKNLNREIISIALTKRLEERLQSTFNSYNPDSLIYMVQWAEKYNQYKEFDQKNAKLYRVIYKHWIQFVANKLRDYYDQEPSRKYDFKFQFLTGICQSKNLSPPIGNTNREKIMHHLIAKEYAYLFRKFWYDTGLIYKLVGFVFLVLTCYGYYRIFKKHFGKS
jgi:hypothetical protein